MEVLDFADFDRKFELKINEASEDLIAKKEQGKVSIALSKHTSFLCENLILPFCKSLKIRLINYILITILLCRNPRLMPLIGCYFRAKFKTDMQRITEMLWFSAAYVIVMECFRVLS